MIGCSSNSVSEQAEYSVYIYDENLVHHAPSQEYSEQFEELMQSEYLKEISFSETLPQNHEKSPVIIVSKSVGNIELDTSSYLELFEFFEGIK
jgi:hypothetical protein